MKREPAGKRAPRGKRTYSGRFVKAMTKRLEKGGKK